MNNDHIRYLESIGTTRTGIIRANAMWEMVNNLSPDECLDVFVCDSVNAEGIRTQGNIWYITNNYLAEAKNFITTSNVDIAGRHLGIRALDFHANDFTFAETSDTSSFSAKAWLGDSMMTMTFQAVRNNCPQLKTIAERYLVPMVLRR